MDSKVINLFHQKQIQKFQQFCKISQLIYDQSMYMYQPIFSIFYVLFTLIQFSSFELIIMLFWSLIYISWLFIITDCLNQCTEWSILTLLYMLLLVDQFKDDINSKIYQSKDKCSSFYCISFLGEIFGTVKSRFYLRYISLTARLYLQNLKNQSHSHRS